MPALLRARASQDARLGPGLSSTQALLGLSLLLLSLYAGLSANMLLSPSSWSRILTGGHVWTAVYSE